MNLYLLRFDQTDRGTTGLLFIDGKPYCFTVERPWMDNQKSISCIPEGRYQVAFREDPTPLTMHYRKKYDFFSFHLEVKEVKDRSGIYIHIGNYPKDVEGCIAVARGAGPIASHYITDSKDQYRVLYIKLKAEIQRSGAIPLTITSKVL